MKIKTLSSLTIAVAAIAIGIGCATKTYTPGSGTIGGFLAAKTDVVTVTNTVEVVQTNTVTVTKDQTNTYNIPVFTTNFVTEVTTKTNVQFIPGPIINTVQSGAAMAAPFIPPPYGNAVDIGASVFGALGLLLANWQTNRYKDRTAQLTAVVNGVESLTPEVGNIVKKAIQGEATDALVQDGLHAFVSAVTDPPKKA